MSAAMQVCPRCGTRLVAVRERVGPSAQALAPAVVGNVAAHDRWRARVTGVAGYAKAPPGARVLAYLIDSLVGVAMMLPGAALLGLGAALERESLMAAGGITFGIGALYALWYSFTRDGAPGGAGIGKRRMGLMVVHLPTDAPATRGQSAVRTLVMSLLGAVPLVGPFIEPVLGLASADGRRLGDRAADTQVVTAAEYAAR